jgi:hypothetical protein
MKRQTPPHDRPAPRDGVLRRTKSEPGDRGIRLLCPTKLGREVAVEPWPISTACQLVPIL